MRHDPYTLGPYDAGVAIGRFIGRTPPAVAAVLALLAMALFAVACDRELWETLVPAYVAAGEELIRACDARHTRVDCRHVAEIMDPYGSDFWRFWWQGLQIGPLHCLLPEGVPFADPFAHVGTRLSILKQCGPSWVFGEGSHAPTASFGSRWPTRTELLVLLPVYALVYRVGFRRAAWWVLFVGSFPVVLALLRLGSASSELLCNLADGLAMLLSVPGKLAALLRAS